MRPEAFPASSPTLRMVSARTRSKSAMDVPVDGSTKNSSSSSAAARARSTIPKPPKVRTTASSSSSSLAVTQVVEGSRKRRRAIGTTHVPSSSAAAAAAASPVPVTRARRRANDPKASRKPASSNDAASSISSPFASGTPVSSSKKRGKPESAKQKPKSSSKRAKATSPKPLEGIVNCGICFDEQFDFAGVLNSCKHGYCFDCIQKWSESSNTCPQCKRRFKTITKTEVKSGKKIQAIKVQKRDFGSSNNNGILGLAVEPLFGVGPQASQIVTPLDLLHHHFLQSLLFGGVYATGDSELYDDEDDEDYDDSEEGHHVCDCCGFTAHMDDFDDRCPSCGCPGHDGEDDVYELESDDGIVALSDDDSSGGAGSRENPIEIDDD